MDLTMRAFAHLGGNFEVTPNRNFGWSIFQSPFLLFVNSNNWLDYSIIIRLVGIAVSSGSIFLMYLLGRKFFEKKYAIIATILFAFEPHLNQVSGLAQTEPLFILSLMGSFFFILRKNNDRWIILSFILAGMAYSIRPMGLVLIIILSIIYFTNFRTNPKPLKFLLFLVVFLLVILPISFIRFEQYEDPLFYGDVSKGFVKETAMLDAENVKPVTASEFIKNEGIFSFVNEFIFQGIYNILKGLLAISFPYLVILIPIGIILSLKVNSEIKNFILANWIFVITSLISLIVVFSINLSPRFLLPLLPFLIIFSTLTIKKYTESKLNPLHKNKDITIIVILGIVLASSIFFTYYEFPPPDKQLEIEKIEFSRYLQNDLEGKIFNEGWSSQYFSYVGFIDNNLFKTYYLDKEIEMEKYLQLERVILYGDSIENIILAGWDVELTHMVIEENQFSLKFLNHIYSNEKEYPYLVKVFDSEEQGFKKLKAKVFEIDYKKFDKFYGLDENENR